MHTRREKAWIFEECGADTESAKIGNLELAALRFQGDLDTRVHPGPILWANQLPDQSRRVPPEPAYWEQNRSGVGKARTCHAESVEGPLKIPKFAPQRRSQANTSPPLP